MIRGAGGGQRAEPGRNTRSLLAVLFVAVSLVVGIGLRTVRLGSVPPGLNADEACNGYDAYSILTTGRDQHGNLLPLLPQGFNDYRLPLFDYSLVPLIGAFGLKPAVVRLGAAIWGVADLIAITLLAGVALGWPGAAVAAVFGALSPWHVSLSRFGAEYITASATVTIAMLSFFLWLRQRSGRWLLASGAFFGLSLYSYSITKPVIPLLIVLLAVLYRRELARARLTALCAVGLLLLVAAPQAAVLYLHPGEILEQANRYSLFRYMSACPDCPAIEARAAGPSVLYRLENLGANWLGHFTPSFLFLKGDIGDHWLLLRLPVGGQLLPEQAPLIVLALLALLSADRRRLGLLLLGWIMIAAVPAALVTPPGIWFPDRDQARSLATPQVLVRHPMPNHPLTPALLLSHPSARRDLLAIAPWIILSALGLEILLERTSARQAVRNAAAGLLVAGAVFHGGRFVSSYFIDYPVVAAPYFQYGMKQVVQAIERLDDRHEMIIVTNVVTMPYIYVLFFQPYPPAVFQHETVIYGSGVTPASIGLHAPVIGFDHYGFVDPWAYYERITHGIFVFPGDQRPPAPPAVSIRYPDGGAAYNIVIK